MKAEGTYSIIMDVSKPIILFLNVVNFKSLITQALFLCTGLNFTANLSAIWFSTHSANHQYSLGQTLISNLTYKTKEYPNTEY